MSSTTFKKSSMRPPIRVCRMSTIAGERYHGPALWRSSASAPAGVRTLLLESCVEERVGSFDSEEEGATFGEFGNLRRVRVGGPVRLDDHVADAKAGAVGRRTGRYLREDGEGLRGEAHLRRLIRGEIADHEAHASLRDGRLLRRSGLDRRFGALGERHAGAVVLAAADDLERDRLPDFARDRFADQILRVLQRVA